MRCLYYLDVLAGKCICLVTQSDSIYVRISIKNGIFLNLIDDAVKCNTLYQKNSLLWHNQPPMMEWQKIKIPSSRQTITKYNMREQTSQQPTPSLQHQAIRLYFSKIVAWFRLTTQNRRSADFSKNL